MFVVAAEPSSTLVGHLATIIHPLFKLYAFCRQGVVHLRWAYLSLIQQVFAPGSVNSEQYNVGLKNLYNYLSLTLFMVKI